MNKIIRFLPFIILIYSCQKGETIDPSFYTCNLSFPDSSASNPKNEDYCSLLSELTAKGVPGILMSVYHQDRGLWIGVSGKADLYNNVDMQPCNISRVGSTVKMFTAATVLILQEEGKLDLDDKIADYLEGDVITKIKNADKATIRQLLQHSSGIYNYIQSLQFQTASLNDLIRLWNAEDLLKYAYGRKAYFQPGEDVRYSNTNYILLGMLITKVEGKPFYQVFKEKLFIPLGLSFTRFAAEDLWPEGIVRGYIDLYSNLQVLESTYYSGWDYYTADGGLISNPVDLSNFFRSLMNGEVLAPSSLAEMLSWQEPEEQDPEFFDIWYGLGIFKMETPYGIAYFHSGDAIGYYCNMIYFPDDGTTVVYASNGNYGQIDECLSTRSAIDHILKETVN
ncbi:MAG TPA: serine hydrolase domain-containing protein [Bacteroidales bacterium]|nr:serine hydrolase domain-containing protein [Bacteroidales bacterium]